MDTVQVCACGHGPVLQGNGTPDTCVACDGERPLVKFPFVTVQLVGEDGNAFAILARAQRAMREARVDRADIDAFIKEATSGNYDHLLQTVMRWVEVS